MKARFVLIALTLSLGANLAHAETQAVDSYAMAPVSAQPPPSRSEIFGELEAVDRAKQLEYQQRQAAARRPELPIPFRTQPHPAAGSNRAKSAPDVSAQSPFEMGEFTQTIQRALAGAPVDEVPRDDRRRENISLLAVRGKSAPALNPARTAPPLLPAAKAPVAATAPKAALPRVNQQELDALIAE